MLLLLLASAKGIDLRLTHGLMLHYEIKLASTFRKQ